MVKCPFCGKEYEDNMQYCPFCGGDNLEDDGFKNPSTLPEIANKCSTKQKKVIRSENTIVEEAYIDGFYYKMEFDMENKEEKAHYENIQNIRHQTTLRFLIGFPISFIFFICMLVSSRGTVKFEVMMLLGVISLAIGMSLIISGSYKLIRMKKAKIAYIKYDVELKGGKIISYDDEIGRLVYELDGGTHIVEVSRGRFHRPVNY